MAKDREKHSEFNDNDKQLRDGETEDEETDGDAGEPLFEQPLCPQCGWHNTRPSYSTKPLDIVVRLFGFRPYRCRSCGNRFRVIRRVRKG